MRLGGRTIFICAAGLLIALAGLPGCGGSAGNAAQNVAASSLTSGSASGAPAPSSSCTSSAFMHRTGHLRASQRATLTAALVPADDPDPGLNLDGPRPPEEDQENVLQQEQGQENWASDGINNANENPEASQQGNSLQQESEAVAETEEVELWEDDLKDPDTFGEKACAAIEALSKDAENLDNVDQMCTAIRQAATDATLDAVCGVVQDANSKFEEVFPCNDLDVTQWLLDMLSKLFCPAAPSG